eukprot:scaffold3945_cov105-Isochrysis_galbana.AAC.11
MVVPAAGADTRTLVPPPPPSAATAASSMMARSSASSLARASSVAARSSSSTSAASAPPTSGASSREGELGGGHLCQQPAEPRGHWLAALDQVAAQDRKQLLVGAKESVQPVVLDLKPGRVRQEVVAHEEGDEHEVVQHALQ